MADNSSSQPAELDMIKGMMTTLYEGVNRLVVENSTELQKQLHSEFNSTRGVLDSMQKDAADIKVMLETRAEYLRGLENVSAEENKIKPDGYEIISNENTWVKRNEELEASKKELNDTIAEMNTEHHQIHKALSAAQNSATESDYKQNMLKIQIGRLQKHITKNATNANELIDSEVKGKIDIIRARTQSIVKKYCVGLPSPMPRRDRVDFENMDEDLQKKMSQLLYKDDLEIFCTYWIRSKVYAILESKIFKQHVFGLEEDLESKLGEFERLISKHNPDSDISDWRVLTTQYCRSLKMKNQPFVEKVAAYLENLFHPWMPEKRGTKSRSGARPIRERHPSPLRQELTEICQAAYDLAVMLRQSRDKYWFETVAAGTKIEASEDDKFEAEDMNGPKSKYIGSNIWVCLFGALVKESLDGERYVMAKAWVICNVVEGSAERPVSPKRPVSR